jgi:hypothetical protein
MSFPDYAYALVDMRWTIFFSLCALFVIYGSRVILAALIQTHY